MVTLRGDLVRINQVRFIMQRKWKQLWLCNESYCRFSEHKIRKLWSPSQHDVVSPVCWSAVRSECCQASSGSVCNIDRQVKTPQPEPPPPSLQFPPTAQAESATPGCCSAGRSSGLLFHDNHRVGRQKPIWDMLHLTVVKHSFPFF